MERKGRGDKGNRGSRGSKGNQGSNCSVGEWKSSEKRLQTSMDDELDVNISRIEVRLRTKYWM